MPRNPQLRILQQIRAALLRDATRLKPQTVEPLIELLRLFECPVLWSHQTVVVQQSVAAAVDSTLITKQVDVWTEGRSAGPAIEAELCLSHWTGGEDSRQQQ